MKLYKTKKNCGKLLLGILAFCTGMILLTGCGSSSEQKQNKNEETAEENKEEDKVQIGLTVDSFVIERWIRDRDVFVATARELGAEVNVQDAGADVKEQISQIEYFINKQVDVIVVIARDCGALSDAIQKAQSAGISVISYDRMVNNANTDLYISFDNRKVGEIMAQALVNALPQGGDVFMIQGSSSDNNVQMVKQGFDDMLADTDLHVVYEANCDGWTAELAAGYVEEALEKYPHVQGIMCGNDDIASQVVQVLAENQLAGKVVVAGQDCDLAACQRIVEGTQYMTAFKSIEDLAREAAQYAVEMGKGTEVSSMPGVTDTINDGTYKIYRPFNIATKGDVSEAAQDFINYIMSKDGQAVIEENKYISVGEPEEYKSNGAEGKVVVAGSSSVSPVMEKLKEAYEKVNDKVEIEIQTSDSTTGMQNTIDGICDIGMASRELKDSETEAGLTATVIANDGIAVVVNNDNPIDELTSDQVKSVFTGETTTWADLEK